MVLKVVGLGGRLIGDGSGCASGIVQAVRDRIEFGNGLARKSLVEDRPNVARSQWQRAGIWQARWPFGSRKMGLVDGMRRVRRLRGPPRRHCMLLCLCSHG